MRLPVCIAALALACASGAAAHPRASATAAAARSLVYVSNEASNDVTVIDPATDERVATIAVGKRPRGLRASADGRWLYVALSGSPRSPPGADESKLPPADRAADGIGVVDLAMRKLVRVLPSGDDPESFDLSPDGKRLYVSNEESATASVVDLDTGRITATVPVGAEP